MNCRQNRHGKKLVKNGKEMGISKVLQAF